MGQQIKKLEKSLETFPPPQSDKDLFVEKISISFNVFESYYRYATIKVTYVVAQEKIEKMSVLREFFLCHCTITCLSQVLLWHPLPLVSLFHPVLKKNKKL